MEWWSNGVLVSGIEQDIKHNNLLSGLDTELDRVESELREYIDNRLVNSGNDISIIRDAVIQLQRDMILVKEYVRVMQQTYTITDSNNNVFSVSFEWAILFSVVFL